MKNAKDVSALKAVSQILMHENLTITDGVYGILSETDIKNQIAELGQRIENLSANDVESLLTFIKRVEAYCLIKPRLLREIRAWGVNVLL